MPFLRSVLQPVRHDHNQHIENTITTVNPPQIVSRKLSQALVDAGSRVALTTHYTQLKELAARDDRFGVSAMQFVDGRPTYRLIKGAVGESFALQASALTIAPRPRGAPWV